MSSAPMRSHRHLAAGAAFVFLVLPAIPRVDAQSWDITKTRKIAESQHEIVMILIRKKEYSKAADEANKIFQMKWPDDQEPVLLDELVNIARKFNDCKQPEIAVRLLDTNLPAFKTFKSQAAIWKEKGYSYEKMGKHDDALASFREAQRLEKLDKLP